MELSAKDLRVGNYYLYKGSEIKLDVSDLKEIDHNLLDLLKPIQLTEDWLLKFGWKEDHKTDKNEMQFSKKIPTGEILFHSDRLKNEITFDMVLLLDECVIKYVHQLQNLYQSLTNTELNIMHLDFA